MSFRSLLETLVQQQRDWIGFGAWKPQLHIYPSSPIEDQHVTRINGRVIEPMLKSYNFAAATNSVDDDDSNRQTFYKPPHYSYIVLDETLLKLVIVLDWNCFQRGCRLLGCIFKWMANWNAGKINPHFIIENHGADVFSYCIECYIHLSASKPFFSLGGG